MKIYGTHIHGAHLDTLACVVLLQVLDEPRIEERLRAKLAGLRMSADDINLIAVGQVESALAEMRSARRLLLAHRDGGGGSADGTSEPTSAGDPALSAVSSSALSVVEVAERLQKSESYVRRLCRDGALSATGRGRTWSIDAASVDQYESTRSRVA